MKTTHRREFNNKLLTKVWEAWEVVSKKLFLCDPKSDIFRKILKNSKKTKSPILFRHESWFFFYFVVISNNLFTYISSCIFEIFQINSLQLQKIVERNKQLLFWYFSEEWYSWASGTITPFRLFSTPPLFLVLGATAEKIMMGYILLCAGFSHTDCL